MADPKDAQDHNLPASQRKIKKAREDGQLPRSRDLPHFMVMAALALLAAALLPQALQEWRAMLQDGLRFNAEMVQRVGIMEAVLADQAGRFVRAVGLIGVVLALAAVVANLASGGWNFTWKALGPKWNHLDPIAGMGRLFSGQAAGTALKAVLLALVLAAVAAWALHQRFAQYVGLMSLPLEEALAQTGRLLLGGVVALLIALALFAAIDLPLQYQLYLRKLRMSRSEAKQEHKETEGSPEIKSRQKQRMREVTRRRMMAAVPGADLVVMNPSHYAVALKYDETRDSAPRVVAKGADLVALRIRDLAQEHAVPVLQAPALARALFAHAKLDQEVPGPLFAAVAQVLAYVLQLKGRLAARFDAPPNPEVPEGFDPHAEKAKAATDEEAYA
ncbi:flagellar biosynthesis protein FlhB [Inhella sp.]|uniref:EscU/YscU/HrcU family type III secretion system export apparatus switch protein n=1 Tax=Inhella sp. TaxID=1921806 RepID=UPI0035B399D4